MLFYRDSMPKLDLHGMDREITRILVSEFLHDQAKLGNQEVAIIHGIGTGALRSEVHHLLIHHPLVEEYKMDYFNAGCTLVKLKSEIDKK